MAKPIKIVVKDISQKKENVKLRMDQKREWECNHAVQNRRYSNRKSIVSCTLPQTAIEYKLGRSERSGLK
jgi:hypothetical protein